MFPGLRNPRLAALSLRGRQARIASFSKPARRAVSEVSMADAARFPHLALPFTITGAAAGWLSAGLVQHPVLSSMDMHLRFTAAVFAAMMGLGTGLLLSRWVVGEQYDWQVDAPDPAARPRTDSWPRHVATILLAGALVGAFLWSIRHSFADMRMGVTGYVIGGVVCTLPFVPVLAAVLSFARRAQRARLGSLVAASDRRAMWGVLATALSIGTLEALPEDCLRGIPLWHGSGPALTLFAACVILIAAVLALDLRAFRRARGALGPGLALLESGSLAVEDAAAARLDLGLGDEVRARLQQDGAPYRSRERVTALVTGRAGEALSVLRGAVRRGGVRLLVCGVVAAAHLVASGDRAALRYEEVRCSLGLGAVCGQIAGQAIREAGSVDSAVLFYERGCDRGDGGSCIALSALYRGAERPEKRDMALVALYEYRAAQRGLCPGHARLVRGAENICVEPGDPRYPN